MILISKPRKVRGHCGEPHWQAVSFLEFLSYVRGRKFAARKRCVDQIVKFAEKSVLTRCGSMAIFDWAVYHLHQVHDFHQLLSRQFSFEGQSVLRSFVILEFNLDPLSQVGEHLPYQG